MSNVRLFQSRLSSKLNKMSRKLQDNSTGISGVATDCIRITAKLTDQGDIISRKIDDLDVISVIFPALIDVPLKKVVSSTNKTVIIPYTFESQPFEVLVPSTSLLDVNDLIIKYYENLDNEDPYIAIMEIKDILGTFGARSIIYQKYKATFYDGQLPPEVITWIMEMAQRRQLLQW